MRRSARRPRTPTAPGPTPWARLGTEARHPRSTGLDVLDTRSVVELLLDEDRRGLECARRRAARIARAAEAFARAMARGGRVVLAGAGSSGRLGVLEAAECPPTFGTRPRRIRAVMAGGRRAVFRSAEGAEDRSGEGRRAARGLGRRDLLIGVSASSVTPFVRAALMEARRRGAASVLVTCAGPRGLAGLAGILIALDTGPEVLAGSTRLKAGSATKAVLNAISTAAMVRLGKTYDNLMVDVTAGSAKLRDRARRIVESAAGVKPRLAAKLLENAGGQAKTAIVMALLRLDASAARRRLARARGRLRAALRGGRG